MIVRPDRFLALNFHQFLCGFGIAAGIHNDPQVPLHLQAMRWTPSNCQMDAVWTLLWWQQVPVRKKLAKALKTNRLLECHKLDLFGISYGRTLRRLNPSVGNRTSSCYPTMESDRSPWHFFSKESSTITRHFLLKLIITPLEALSPARPHSLVASSGNPTVFIPAAAAGLEGTVTRLHWLHQIPQGYLKASHMSLGPNMTGANGAKHSRHSWNPVANPLPLQKKMGKW